MNESLFGMSNFYGTKIYTNLSLEVEITLLTPHSLTQTQVCVRLPLSSFGTDGRTERKKEERDALQGFLLLLLHKDLKREAKTKKKCRAKKVIAFRVHTGTCILSSGHTYSKIGSC